MNTTTTITRSTRTATTITTTTRTPPADWMSRVYYATEAKALEYRRAHHGNKMSPVCWTALWEKIRQEVCGTAWACERQRGYATRVALG